MTERMLGTHGEQVEMPTNAELKGIFETHAKEDSEFKAESAAFQAEQLRTNQTLTDSLASLHKKLNDIPNNEQTAQIVSNVLRELLLNKGKLIYTGVITTAAIVAALVIILGGFKSILGWIGFTQLKP